MSVYLNNSAPNETIASEGSLGTWLARSRPVISDPSEALRAQKLRLPNGEPLYLSTETKLSAWLAAGPALMYWPTDTSGVIPNLGSVSLPNASLVQGAAPSATELVPGAKSVALDGVNDYIDTGWKTRINYIADPIFTNPTVTKCWAPTGTGATLERPSGELPLGLTGNYCKVNVPLETASRGISSSTTAAFVVPIAAGERLDIGAWTKVAATAAIRFEVIWRNAEGATIENKVLSTIESNGIWRWDAVTATAPTNTAGALIRITTGGLNKAASFSVWGMVAEKGRTTTIAAGEQFPTPDNLISGLAGWSGIANESASDSGVFARGTNRTFVFAAKREKAVGHSIVFSASGERPFLQIQESGLVSFGVNAGSVSLSATGVWAQPDKHIAGLVFSPESSSAQLYLDGVGAGAKTQNEKYVPPTGALTIGRWTGQFFQGPTLPFAVYPRALSAAEVVALTA